MTTRGAWENAMRFAGVATLLCTWLLVAVLGRTGSHLSAGETRNMSIPQTAPAEATKPSPRWADAFGKLPLSFEENQGQTAREVRFVSHGNGYELFLTPEEVVLALRSNQHPDLSPQHRAATMRALRKAHRVVEQRTAVRLQIEGANPNLQISGLDRMPTLVNYFIGNDPKKWHTGVPSYGRVRYAGIYPGVDLVFYGNQRRLEYDFVVAPGGDPRTIHLKIEGARKMRVTADGDLVLTVPGGEVTLQKPLIYQQLHGEKRQIIGNYILAANHRVTFSVPDYDRSQPLILDPVLNYSTYLGGSAFDAAYAIAVNNSGDAFIAGQTVSTNFPPGAKGAFSTAPAGNLGASFVAELDPTGANLLYSTYLAGTTTSSADGAFGIALDSTGKAYVTGQTSATDFPTTANALNPGPVSATTAAAGTVYLTKLDPTVNGTSGLLYSTYVSGTGGEYANCVAVDTAGNAYIAGQTLSTDFPTANPLQSSPSNASGVAFITRIDTTKSLGASLIFSTYFGGNGANAGNSVGSLSLGFGEQISGIAVDSSQNVYVAGQTSSTDAPASFITSATAYQAAPPAGNSLGSSFVSKIATTAGTLTYSTYLAGSLLDEGFGIALGPGNVAYVTGKADSSDFPTVGTPFDATNSASGKAFISVLDTTKAGTNSLAYSTFLGGSGGDVSNAIAVDSVGIAYVTGLTSSSDFGGAGTLSSLGALQTTLLNTTGPGDAFIAKINPSGGLNGLLYATYYGGSGDGGDVDQGFGIAIDSANPPNAYVAGQTFSTDIPVLSAFQTKLNGTGAPAAGNSDGFVAALPLVAGLTVTPFPSFNFGTQPLSVATGAQAFTVTNNTANAAAFTSIVVNGVTPAANTDFAISNDTCSPSVAAGLMCNVSVTFTPSVAAAESATLVITATITNGGQNSTIVLNVNLTGTGAASAPAVGLAPTSLAFGNQTLNTTSAAKTVTLTNTGTGALTITSIAASGDFAEASTGATACPISPATLAAGANCIISVTFTPTALGARAGNLTITDNAASSPQMVPLTGTGTGVPSVGLAPTSLAFGNQALNTPSTAKTVTLTNTGTAALTITSIAASGDFAETSTGATACPISPATLAAGANCIISVTFTPTALGARAGNLTITDNAASSPQLVPLTGTGTGTPDFGLTGPAGVQPVTLGQTLNFSVTVTGTGGFNSPVALACTGAPALANCTVTSPVTPPVAPPSTIQAQVSMTTTALVVPPQGIPTPTAPPQQVVPLVLALMMLFSLVWVRRPRLRLAMATAVLALIAITGCNGLKHQRTPKGPATLTITGTSGALTHNVQVQISVN